MSLPEFVVFTQTANNGGFKVLQPTGDRFEFGDGEGVLSPRVKFAVENADNGLVHLRHCYTNKFLAKTSASENWTAVVVKELVVNDKTSENRPSFRHVVKDNKVEFFHVMNGKDISVAQSDFIDHSSLVILPNRVAFKGKNDKHLRWYKHGALYLTLDCEDPKEETANFTIIPRKNGDICIQRIGKHPLTHQSMYWYTNDPNGNYSPGFINVCCTESNVLDTSDAYHYQVVKARFDAKDTKIALRGRRGGLFCKTVSGNYLKAASTTITDDAQFEVIEPVLDRLIQVKEYRLENRIVNKTMPLRVDGSDVPNNDYNITRHHTFKSEQTDKTRRKWSNSVTVHTSVNTTFKGSILPKFKDVLDLSFEVNYLTEITNVKTWENEDIKSSNCGIEERVEVPPRKKAVISVCLYEVSCEIPFSYKQTDKLTDGTEVHSEHDDGVFKANCHKYVSDVRYEDLP